MPGSKVSGYVWLSSVMESVPLVPCWKPCSRIVFLKCGLSTILWMSLQVLIRNTGSTQLLIWLLREWDLIISLFLSNNLYTVTLKFDPKTNQSILCCLLYSSFMLLFVSKDNLGVLILLTVNLSDPEYSLPSVWEFSKRQKESILYFFLVLRP